jgi:hypothetical protein
MANSRTVLRPPRISAKLAMEAKSLMGNGLQLVGWKCCSCGFGSVSHEVMPATVVLEAEV